VEKTPIMDKKYWKYKIKLALPETMNYSDSVTLPADV
jgi:hypothetical protein